MRPSAPVLFASLLVSALLAGCTNQQTGLTSPSESTGPKAYSFGIAGRVHGGQQPVTSSKVYLYAVSTLNGGPSISLLKAPGYVTTDSTGSFSLANDITCPTAPSYVYLLATGGNPGLAANNPYIALGAGLGLCSSITTASYLTINEVTTVAMTSALANYATSETQVGSASDLSAAFANIPLLVNPTSGAAQASSSTTAVPQATINALANDIAACINSSGVGAPCSTLFSAANVTGAGGTPFDTFQAALNIAKNPSVNASAIFNLGTANAVFAPAISAAPATWSIAATPVSTCFVPDANTYVFHTSSGDITIELRPDVAPQNVASFLSYLNSGSYTNSIIHRSAPSFLIQGGGYYVSNNTLDAIPITVGPVPTEPGLSNLRGTLALAGTPGSATSQFFFNAADNTSLDGSYTVIGKVASIQGSQALCGGANGGLAVIDAINADTIVNAGGAFQQLPVINYTSGTPGPSNFVYVTPVGAVTNTATQPSMPVFTPAGPFAPSGTTSVSLTDATPGAIIYYAVFLVEPDPTMPGFYLYTQQGPYVAYNGPILVTANEAIQAYAKAPNLSQESLPNIIYTSGNCACSTPPPPQ